jgi:hypothetical protein
MCIHPNSTPQNGTHLPFRLHSNSFHPACEIHERFGLPWATGAGALREQTAPRRSPMASVQPIDKKKAALWNSQMLPSGGSGCQPDARQLISNRGARTGHSSALTPARRSSYVPGGPISRAGALKHPRLSVAAEDTPVHVTLDGDLEQVPNLLERRQLVRPAMRSVPMSPLLPPSPPAPPAPPSPQTIAVSKSA